MKQVLLDLSPEEYHNADLLAAAVCRALRTSAAAAPRFRVARRSIDCRRRNVLYHTTVEVYEPHESIPSPADIRPPQRDCRQGQPVIVVGAGPAGLFAALRLIEAGLRPIIIERGKAVEERKADIVALSRSRQVDPDSNWCFGEGGAGTYSDGKLYTRSTKRGDVGAVLRTFVAHGADPDIMLDAHAHIGTDRLGAIIARMRHTIVACGGEYRFGTRVQDIALRNGRVCGVVDSRGILHEGIAVVLATGHSARDIYHLFASHGWSLEAKPFAIGVRVEHPQSLINEIQYHGSGYSPLLPPAAYSLVTQVGHRGVFSFCMCPGGVIVPAATGERQQVVNGMSNAHRSSPFANSGIAVTVSPADVPDGASGDPLALLRFQQQVEQRAFEAAAHPLDAPAQRLVDFMRRRPSSSLNRSNYMGPTSAAPLHEVLPPFVTEALIQGFKDFDRKMKGFVTAEASLLAVESRTSSPVRIPRHPATLQHPQLPGLYPCGEGAGYAGGIVSSALDGIRCAEALIATL